MFPPQARRVEALGAVGGIIVDNVAGGSAASSPMFAMSGDGTDDVTVPVVFLFEADAQPLLAALDANTAHDMLVTLGDDVPVEPNGRGEGWDLRYKGEYGVELNEYVNLKSLTSICCCVAPHK